ncbi:protein ARV1 [Leptopilina heterotoma]|uniref:protein ARV1 n=1 Tax=Leptopilina heterotoma TaxID=63436 RepID=UPI001CA861C4|nr:protein ARV1 [Leptopilina heterotoma]XP_043471490.1 protein ARV1 [Leptopilina heterotoma]
MYTCTNCGAEVAELYRRYSPSVLKVLKCSTCGCLADKYIEYDPVIVLLDLILLQKSAYRHLFYNSSFKSYWKLMMVLILGESFQKWFAVNTSVASSILSTPFSFYIAQGNDVFEGEKSLYILLIQTTLSLSTFILTIILCMELRWLLSGRRPQTYKPINLVKALVIGRFPNLLGLLGIVWKHNSPKLHNVLIYGYELLCLLTAYSVVSDSRKSGSSIVLILGLLAHSSVSSGLFGMPQSPPSNVTSVQS